MSCLLRTPSSLRRLLRCSRLFLGRLLPEHWWPRWIVGDRVQLALSKVQALHLRERERARTETSEDRDLVAALVHGAIAVEPLRDRQRRTPRSIRGDQGGRRAGAEPEVPRGDARGRELDDAQPILA